MFRYMQPNEVTPEPWDWKQLRTRSSALFGSQHRLGIAALAATAAEDELYAAHLAARAGLTRSEASRQLTALETAGLVAPGRRGRGSQSGRQPDLFTRRDNEFWKLIEVLSKPYRKRPKRQRRATPRSRPSPGSRGS
jgi:DNA-binding transcriptional ArsR family regulator